MSNLKEQLIKLGSKRKDLRPHIRPILDEISSLRSVSARLRKRTSALYGEKQVKEQYFEFSKAVNLLHHASQVGSGRARQLGLSIKAAEVLDVLKNLRHWFLDIAWAFDREDWELALVTVKETEREWLPVRRSLFKIQREWADSGNRRLERAADREALQTVDDFLHQIQWKLEQTIRG